MYNPRADAQKEPRWSCLESAASAAIRRAVRGAGGTTRLPAGPAKQAQPQRALKRADSESSLEEADFEDWEKQSAALGRGRSPSSSMPPPGPVPSSSMPPPGPIITRAVQSDDASSCETAASDGQSRSVRVPRRRARGSRAAPSEKVASKRQRTLQPASAGRKRGSSSDSSLEPGAAEQ